LLLSVGRIQLNRYQTPLQWSRSLHYPPTEYPTPRCRRTAGSTGAALERIESHREVVASADVSAPICAFNGSPWLWSNNASTAPSTSSRALLEMLLPARTECCGLLAKTQAAPRARVSTFGTTSQTPAKRTLATIKMSGLKAAYLAIDGDGTPWAIQSNLSHSLCKRDDWADGLRGLASRPFHVWPAVPHGRCPRSRPRPMIVVTLPMYWVVVTPCVTAELLQTTVREPHGYAVTSMSEPCPEEPCFV
jgi:hypothetical protein